MMAAENILFFKVAPRRVLEGSWVIGGMYDASINYIITIRLKNAPAREKSADRFFSRLFPPHHGCLLSVPTRYPRA